MLSIVLFAIVETQNRITKSFAKAGYILDTNANSSDANTPSVKYYFEDDTNYKYKYPEKVVFNDTEGEKVVTDITGIVHYLDGSMSVLKKGVIVDLEDLDSSLLKYYNIFETSILQYSNDAYFVDNRGSKIKFNSFILKISDSKYLVASKKLQLKLSDNEIVNVDGYVEINFTDGNIIKIENQEVSYQTISSDSSILIGDDINIDFSDNSILKGGERKLSLSQLVINSDDNIQIVPEKEKSNPTNDEKDNENNNPNTGGNIGNSPEVDDDQDDESEDDTKQPTIPNFSIINMNVTSNKIDASIAITDSDQLLSGSIISRIIENSTGKIIYSKEDIAGTFALDIVVENLKPDTNYSLIMTSDYIIDGTTYTRDFVAKPFRTELIGITFQKNYFTRDTLSFVVKTESYSNITKAEMVLLSSADEILKTIELDINDSKTPGGLEVVFDNLDANTKYKVKVFNFLYDDAVISNAFAIEYKAITLKNKPTFGQSSFIIDKKNGQFTLKVNNVSDVDNGIIDYKYEIYDARTLTNPSSTPITVINKKEWGSVDLPVNEISIFRGVPYTFKLVVEFYDNEKYYEYESECSDVFKMDGVEFPSVRFESSLITFERIEGIITITDEGNTVKLEDNVITVVYTDSVGNSNSYTTSGNLSIPISISNLRANETYVISIYTAINLQDGNQTINNCFIGSVIVKTEKTKELLASYENNKDSVTVPFDVKIQLGADSGIDNILEASTLTAVTFNLYSGTSTSGTLIKTVKKVDRDLRPYESDLKREYYDNSFEVTPEFFGMKNDDMVDENYTIQMINAYDYTSYKNNIPIKNDTVTVKSNGFIPDLPPDMENAIEVNVIRNKDAGERYRADLKPETIVGYRIKAGYDNSKKYAKYLKYYIYKAGTNEILPNSERTVNINETGTIDYIEYYLADGTPYDMVDNIFRRGNIYYFAYEAYLDLDFDGNPETRYPYVEGESNIILRSANISPPKQEATLIFYPSDSSASTMNFKYQFSDIDYSLTSNNIYAKINGTNKSSAAITPISDNYNIVQVNNLSPGFLDISVEQALTKISSEKQNRSLIYQYFDGIITPKQLHFHVQLEVNRVIISINDYQSNLDFINKIAALKATFVAPTKTVVVDNLQLENDSIIIDLANISELINQNITVNLEAYYDSGVTGFESAGNVFAIQTLKNANGGGEYLTLNDSLNFKSDVSANGSIFSRVLNSNNLSITNLSSKLSKNLTIQYDSAGISYNYEYLLLKKLNTVSLVSDGSNTVSFNMIIPGVSLHTDEETLNITTTLRNAEVKIDLFGANASTIKDNVIYIELYQTDESATTSVFLREIPVTVADLNYYIEISNLIPMTSYFIKLYGYIYNGTGYEKEQLYDIDYKSPNKNYYFSTLSKVGMTNVDVRYTAKSYTDKYLNVTYNLTTIVGYDRIDYDLYKYVTDENGTTTMVPVDINISSDVVFKNTMTKHIKFLPGSDITLDTDYHLVITPIAYVNINGVQQELILEDVASYDFYLSKLRSPFIGVVSTATDDLGLEFKISIIDVDKAIVNGTYTVKILDNLGNDVTPTEYQNVEYDITALNNIIRLSNLQRNTDYTLIVTTYVDRSNNAIDNERVDTKYTKRTLDDSGVDIGEVTSTMNSTNFAKIDLNFYSSYKLTYINELRYSIYNLNGYAEDNTVPFIPTQVENNNSIYYYQTLPYTLPSPGIYFIELQFLHDGRIIKQRTIQHYYTLN